VALNEGVRRKRGLWRAGRKQLETLVLAPWASRRQRDLLEMVDRLSPMIADLMEAIEQEASNSPAAQRLATHPGVGTLTALAFVLIIREVERFHCGNQGASYLGLVPAEDSSGDRQRLGHISKQGNSLLHTLLSQEQRGQTFQNKQPLPASQAAPVCLSRSAASRSSENFVSLLRHAGPATCDQRGRLRQTR
jgi:transposase